MADTEKEKSSSLLGSIFGSNDTEKTSQKSKKASKKGKKEKEQTSTKNEKLSNLFDTSSKLPDRPQILAREHFVKKGSSAATSESKSKGDGKFKDAKAKIVKGGKKRMREKQRQQEQEQKEEENKEKKKTNNENESDSSSEEKDKETKSEDENNTETEKSTPAVENENEAEEEPSNETVSNKKDQEERTVFVGNLPLDITRKNLNNLFKDCGKVESSRLRSIAATGVKLPPNKKGNQKLMRKVCANTNLVDNTVKKTAQGYVVFASLESVAKALEMNNTTVTIDEISFRIRVDTAQPTIDHTRSVFVGNLPYDADENELHAHFAKGIKDLKNDDSGSDEEGEDNIVEGARVIRDQTTMQCKGFGYVLLKNRDLVADALRLHESKFMNRAIRVQVCGKRYKGKRGEFDSTGRKRRGKSFEGLRSTDAAVKRILAKSSSGDGKGGKLVSSKKRRTYSERNAAFNPAKKRNTTGLSKRATAEAKVGKRVKKLQKRMDTGMGKSKR